MAAQVALKRQQAAEDAIALGLRCATEGSLPIMTQGPLWGPGTVSPPEDKDKKGTDSDSDDLDDNSSDFDNGMFEIKSSQYLFVQIHGRTL